jgi:hypothetical protein
VGKDLGINAHQMREAERGRWGRGEPVGKADAVERYLSPCVRLGGRATRRGYAQLEAAQVFRLHLIGRLAEKSREGPDGSGSDVVGLHPGGEIPDRHVLDHATAQRADGFIVYWVLLSETGLTPDLQTGPGPLPHDAGRFYRGSSLVAWRMHTKSDYKSKNRIDKLLPDNLKADGISFGLEQVEDVRHMSPRNPMGSDVRI